MPLIIDAGIGEASDACVAMELGCDGVLINTAIAKAKKPFIMAEAMKLAVHCWKKILFIRKNKKKYLGSPSSPKFGII